MRTWLLIRFRPQEINLSRKTSTGSNSNGSNSNMIDSGINGTVYGSGFCSGGDYIGGRLNRDLRKQATKSRTVRFEFHITETESAKKWR
ncbi:hypothetical protein MtrunA17_Chr5g0395721 [Medicago truncatula]|uniref:Uncharacterized protein n=1 Tax=Medicago truncatula TaxID=3880 RepID=A0A396HNH9_MEDTR|nr:hypothetical protein MtrunA17_Chr5g0395721 [Medicago truncatula]